MLYEDDIVGAVCEYLIGRGFEIERKCAAKDRGDDIVARHPTGWRLYVEAKGEGSSAEGSNRYGRTFDSGQVRHNVSVAFYRAAVTRDLGDGAGRVAAMAFPDGPEFRKRVAAVAPSIRRLGLVVFWVGGDRSVSVEGDLRPNR